jgi:elongation factor P
MGRGGGTIRVKIKNLHTGSQVEMTYKSGDKVEEIDIAKRQMQYLYADSDEVFFMDSSSFEQMSVPRSILGDSIHFLKEGENAWLMVWQHDDIEEVLDVDLPASVDLKVVDAAPGEKGNSASNMYKDGVLENGMKVRIPLFVNAGEVIKVSTADGTYQSRA